MTADEVTAIASSALFLIIKVAAPLLLVSLAVGLIVRQLRPFRSRRLRLFRKSSRYF